MFILSSLILNIKKLKKMKNTYWFRYFLICSKLANNLLVGYIDQNFAKLFEELSKGVIGNKQMTAVFDNIHHTFCEITANDSDMIFEENDLEEISKLSTDTLQEYYEAYCEGNIRLILEEDPELPF